MSGVRAFVGLGGNLGDPVAQIESALKALDQSPQTRLIRHSGFYRTPPWGITEQAEFVNAVAEIETTLSPFQLLRELLRIEVEAGRLRDETRWGPRLIDLDLLLYGESMIDEDNLRVPHPRMAERAFVMVPLAELEPSLSLPEHGVVSALLAGLDTSTCIRLPGHD
ncbi:MAG TPA: 2-amino-4-hydroxy-6-hydroxymethyldihydropteridine diphosphokinase [Dokdonella sp.]|uniref:2-amino-4-hydroxy-6- hydroxymethyldihydropteridine diphosphokinase n=1 Tax=Dokdonella sp. TaxID=2291710 RepID=UPI002D7FC7DF|nr:2-amino-4-hydroxy-6-hydroxymethyldihydropteridine diphosphokinase [Dokdonella sp.]HET9033434.1 2-amino-4-hydroxy-6-hydroxymethyldihydropteridine diphosphokinase [Dokdonella sp.]